MMDSPSLRSLTARMLLGAALFSAGVARAADTPPTQCPAILAASEIEAGQTGTGWTVVQGSAPRPFAVTVLGIQANGIGPGLDLAIIEVADKSGNRFITDAGGIWAGMSGSPVYIDDKLAGAISYTFSRGASTIGGMTLAENMLELLSYGESAGNDANVPLTMESRLAVAEHLDASLDSVVTSLARLPIPIVASGMVTSAASNLQATLDEQGFHGFLVAGSAATAPDADQGFATPVAGGNFAGVISYGDVTVGGVGTTTYVCGDRALAFGHPLSLRGASTFGANDATAFAIVEDPALGPFKLAAIGSSFGLLDQDRSAAVRATLGTAPDVLPITARLRSTELDRERFGATYVTMPVFVPSLAVSHLLEDMRAVTDSTGGGSALMRWKLRGIYPNGESWDFRRADRMTSKVGIDSAAAFALYSDLEKIQDNQFASIEFTGVVINGRISPVARQDPIVKVLVSRNGDDFEGVEEVRVEPGDGLTFRILVRKPNGSLRSLETELVVPAGASGSGRVVVGGGYQFDPLDSCYSYSDSCPRTFRELLATMTAAPRSDDVVVDLSFYSDYSNHIQARARHRAVVTGRFEFDITASGTTSTTLY